MSDTPPQGYDPEVINLKTCPHPANHAFRELRSRHKEPGPPYYLNMRCRHCPALLIQVIQEKKQPNGDILPVVSTFLWEGRLRKNVPGYMASVTSSFNLATSTPP